MLTKYEKFLKPYFKTKEEIKLYSYIKKYWFEKDYNIYNYYKLITNNNETNHDILNHFYVTNNIAESFHSKLNYYLKSYNNIVPD